MKMAVDKALTMLPMNKLALVWLAVLCLTPVLVTGQTREQQEAIRSIKANTQQYYYGEGTGATFDEAYNSALENLMTSINVFVGIDQRDEDITATGTDGRSVTTGRSTASLSIASMGMMQDVRRIDYGEEPEAGVFVFVTAESVRQMFDARQTKAESLIAYGMEEERNFRISDALRYYSWALCLLQTLPEGDKVTFMRENREEHAKVWLNRQIKLLLAGSKIEAVKVEDVDEPNVKQRVYLRLSYNGQLVDNFDFSFNNGLYNVGPIHATDGRAVADLQVRPASGEMQIKVEYLFKGQAQTLDREVAGVMDNIDLFKFAEANKIVPLTDVGTVPTIDKDRKRTRREAVMPDLQTGGMTMASLEQNRVSLEVVSDTLPYARVMEGIVEAITLDSYDAVRSCFTDEGYEMFQRLVGSGNVALLDNDQPLQYARWGETVICRKLPMQFRFSGNRQFVNDVVFRFDAASARIESVALALTRRAENDILTADKKWRGDWRMDLISFLEDYQTAYALKRLDFIESIFSDDALIVVGTVLKHKPNSAGEGSFLPGITQDEVRYTRYSKEEFINRLRLSFASKEFINLRFNETEILKGSGARDGIFAMQIAQDYYSNNYGDSGYLTLMVNLNGDLPLITIRIWQQEKDTSFTLRSLMNIDNKQK